MTPGSLILVRPDLPHNFKMDENNPADILWVHFDFIYRKDVYKLNDLVTNRHNVLYSDNLPLRQLLRETPIFENGFDFPEFLEVKQPMLMEDIFVKIVSVFERAACLWQLECKIKLLTAIRLIVEQCYSGYASNRKTTGSISDRIANYVYRNYQKKLTLGEIAENIGLNRDYMGKVFKNETGENLSAFINMVRIMHAEELLLNSDLTIQNIAEITGFSDVYYFSKVMKRCKGIPPSKWRNGNEI